MHSVGQLFYTQFLRQVRDTARVRMPAVGARWGCPKRADEGYTNTGHYTINKRFKKVFFFCGRITWQIKIPETKLREREKNKTEEKSQL